ncbi:MAG TPA: hypothetical protein VEP69_05785 [Thermodesulfovibrionales bacterium]|nr:hypothetical protein [Thermodesulfovibrionales bacterium]
MRDTETLTQKLLRILRMISTDMDDIEIDSERLLEGVDYEEEDLTEIWEELEDLETSEQVDEIELDILKALLVYILIRDSAYEKEDIFSFIFGSGRRILWH